jgi:hypothetical protein
LHEAVGKALTGKQIGDLIAGLTDRVRKAGYVVGQVVFMGGDLEALRQGGALGSPSSPARSARSASRATARASAQIERMQLVVVDVPGVKLKPVNFSADGVPVGQAAIELDAERGANSSPVT